MKIFFYDKFISSGCLVNKNVPKAISFGTIGTQSFRESYNEGYDTVFISNWRRSLFLKLEKVFGFLSETPSAWLARGLGQRYDSNMKDFRKYTHRQPDV